MVVQILFLEYFSSWQEEHFQGNSEYLHFLVFFAKKVAQTINTSQLCGDEQERIQMIQNQK